MSLAVVWLKSMSVFILWALFDIGGQRAYYLVDDKHLRQYIYRILLSTPLFKDKTLQ